MNKHGWQGAIDFDMIFFFSCSFSESFFYSNLYTFNATRKINFIHVRPTTCNILTHTSMILPREIKVVTQCTCLLLPNVSDSQCVAQPIERHENKTYCNNLHISLPLPHCQIMIAALYCMHSSDFDVYLYSTVRLFSGLSDLPGNVCVQYAQRQLSPD